MAGIHVGDNRFEQTRQRCRQSGAEQRVNQHIAAQYLPTVAFPLLLGCYLHDRHAQAPDYREIDLRIAPHVLCGGCQAHAHIDATLVQRPGHHASVAAVVAPTAEHDHLCVVESINGGIHGGDYLTPGVLHQHQRRNAQVFDGAPVGFAHLVDVQNPHRRSPGARPQRRSIAAWWRGLRALYHKRYGTGMVAIAYVNGRICSQADASISVFDHGFLFGEGVYDVVRTYCRELFLLDRHFRRLRASAGMIALELPMSNDALERAVRDTMQAFAEGPGRDVPDADLYVRTLVTRGLGDMTYNPAASPAPTLVIIVKPLVAPPESAYEAGVKVALVSTIRNHPGSVNPLIKSNNLLNNALAMQEALKKGAYEAIMRNYRGELASVLNQPVHRQNRACSAQARFGLLAGITREPSSRWQLAHRSHGRRRASRRICSAQTRYPRARPAR